MNTLENFTRLNLNNSNLFDTWNREDKDIIFNTLYTKETIEDAETYLNQFKSDYIKKNVVGNYEISKQRQKARTEMNEPQSGNVFIDEEGEKFRLVGRGDSFQFCYDGSFHISKCGHSSMSGGFTGATINGKKDVWSIDKVDLIKTKQKEFRKFWFFMGNYAGGHRGLYFNCEVKVFKTK